ncbi:hypothetical protein BU17DRAFT_67759 [Hysterangium stoloniferum]|nr:hypothetical protein BU17DRAFT_67759 [Hysterangium stoloniferum]
MATQRWVRWTWNKQFHKKLSYIAISFITGQTEVVAVNLERFLLRSGCGRLWNRQFQENIANRKMTAKIALRGDSKMMNSAKKQFRAEAVVGWWCKVAPEKFLISLKSTPLEIDSRCDRCGGDETMKWAVMRRRSASFLLCGVLTLLLTALKDGRYEGGHDRYIEHKHRERLLPIVQCLNSQCSSSPLYSSCYVVPCRRPKGYDRFIGYGKGGTDEIGVTATIEW